MQALHAADARSARHAAIVAAPVGRGWVVAEDAGEQQQQIPFGNDKQKSKNKNKCNSRFPAGMTTRKAKARARTTAVGLTTDGWRLTTDC